MWGRSWRVGAVTLTLVGVLVGVSTVAGAGTAVEVNGRIGGQDLAGSTGSDPVELRSDTETPVEVVIENRSQRPLEVRTVRIDGRVLGLTFFAYDTAVSLRVAPGATETIRFPLDLNGLVGQATGLIPGSLQILDRNREPLASEPYVADVRGSLWSVYGLFGLALLILTGLSFASLLWALARHRLPSNRLQRGLRFLATGVGVGLIVVFSLSVFRILVPRPGGWITSSVVFAGVFFLVGYFSPSPDEPGEDGDVDEGLRREQDGTVTAPSYGPA